MSSLSDVAFCLDCGAMATGDGGCTFEFCGSLYGFTFDAEGALHDQWAGDPPRYLGAIS